MSFRTFKANPSKSMRLCLASSITEESEISSDSSVNEARLIIANRLGVSVNTVYIIFKGKVLRKKKLLKDYGGISDSSLLHVVCFSNFPKVQTHANPSTEEVSMKSNAVVYSEPKIVSPEEESSDSDDYGEPVVASVVFHVFGDVLNTVKDDVDIGIPVDEITSVIDSDFSIVKTALQTPLFQDILSDTSFVRKLLLSNDMIIEMTKTNPGFLEFINNDESLSDLVRVISDTNGYQDYRHLRYMLIKKIESTIGDHLHLVEEDKLTFPIICTSDHYLSKPNRKCKARSPSVFDKRCHDRGCREDHIALLCQIAANRPDIVKAFMKRTPIYKEIAIKKPELLNELLKPERLKLIASPEMVHAIVKLDDCIRKYREE